MSARPYDRYYSLPATDIEEADRILNAIDPEEFQLGSNKIAYAQARIALAQAKMTGSMRR